MHHTHASMMFSTLRNHYSFVIANNIMYLLEIHLNFGSHFFPASFIKTLINRAFGVRLLSLSLSRCLLHESDIIFIIGGIFDLELSSTHLTLDYVPMVVPLKMMMTIWMKQFLLSVCCFWLAISAFHLLIEVMVESLKAKCMLLLRAKRDESECKIITD